MDFCQITANSPRCLKAVAVAEHESAIANHRSSNRPAWLPASKSRRARCASRDGRISNKEDGDDEHCRHLDFQTGGDRASAHSFELNLHPRLARFHGVKPCCALAYYLSGLDSLAPARSALASLRLWRNFFRRFPAAQVSPFILQPTSSSGFPACLRRSCRCIACARSAFP